MLADLRELRNTYGYEIDVDKIKELIQSSPIDQMNIPILEKVKLSGRSEEKSIQNSSLNLNLANGLVAEKKSSSERV